MTIEKIPLITGLNDVPATDAVKGQNGALVIAKVNQIVDVVNVLTDDSGDDSGGDSVAVGYPQVIVFGEENAQFNLNADHLNKLIFLGLYGGINLAFFPAMLTPKQNLWGVLPSITVINTTSFDIPLANSSGISLFVYPNDPDVGPNNQVLRAKGKLTVYFQDSENAYVIGSIINLSSSS